MEPNEIIIKELFKSRVKTLDALARLKRKIAKKYRVSCPANLSLLKTYHEMVKNKRVSPADSIENLMITRPVRSLSGIVNISVLTKEYPCPGKCLYCPQESGIPKSYVSGEPAVERAKRLRYDPYLQTRKRIEMLEAQGHPTDKIELRIVGGTWSYYPKQYQNWFVRKCFDACNGKTSINLRKAQELNEKARHRIVGLSVETRPDFIDGKEIKRLRELGATLVELGVQSVYDDVLRKSLRGHGSKETILATKLLKDAGFKVLYQIMPNLSGSDIKRDEKMFKELFTNPDFQPDLLKIYPCALLREAPLYKLWQNGRYKPYTEFQMMNLIKKIKKIIPYYVRIQRISRDIPSSSIVSGPAKISNLRQLLSEDMRKKNWQCKCIRCREIKEKHAPGEKIHLFRQDYEASGGKEIFLSFESRKRELYSLLRLRITLKEAIIREIHTYGPSVPIADKGKSPQHHGLGKKLIKTAEKIARDEFNFKKISVIAGVGVRGYFRKEGYKLEDTYMVKSLG
jgi:elongator complex protein 3